MAKNNCLHELNLSYKSWEAVGYLHQDMARRELILECHFYIFKAGAKAATIFIPFLNASYVTWKMHKIKNISLAS